MVGVGQLRAVKRTVAGACGCSGEGRENHVCRESVVFSSVFWPPPAKKVEERGQVTATTADGVGSCDQVLPASLVVSRPATAPLARQCVACGQVTSSKASP